MSVKSVRRELASGRAVAKRVVAKRALVGAAAASLLVTGVVAAPASAAPKAGPLSGRTVFLDPGHQGSAAGHDLNKQVPDGRGGMKDCQTTGATAVTGVKEHTINWNVSQLVKAALERDGARVVMSRNDDTGWGGCVDERAAAANASGADLAVSVHADSTTQADDPARSGFHMIVPNLPVPDATVSSVQAGNGRRATEGMRDAFKRAGFKPANYAGVNDGIVGRSDIAGVNSTRIPIVFIELGNLSNPTEARELSSADGTAKYALAVTNGIKSYLGTAPAPAPVPLKPGEVTPPVADQGEQADLTGLAAIGPLFNKLAGAKSLEEAQQILMANGSDVASEVLKSMLGVVYAVFGGKLPV